MHTDCRRFRRTSHVALSMPPMYRSPHASGRHIPARSPQINVAVKSFLIRDL
ncbi:hypothetical protein D3OALGB2SA_5461 [Olavius algarvensis associated proteobacterium Delta 3]|nr:hypothetical protein D3OALGB2SA_5461 [Olavius algarvensis associated proteobacterium Delta 3]